jgi:hypothetical protein
VSLVVRHAGASPRDAISIVTSWGGALFVIVGLGKQLFLEPR